MVYLENRKKSSFTVHMATYMDFLGPWHILRVAFQQELTIQ